MTNENLEKIAFIDYVTKLRNKNALYEDYGDVDLANKHFIYIDIDDFKRLNTIFGIDVVDQLLVSIANTLNDYCGKSSVYRVAAGQFVLVTESHIMCEPSELQRILIQPVQLENMQILINASIGVLDHDDFPDLSLTGVLRFMHLSLDGVKNDGRHQLVYVDHQTQDDYKERRQIVFNLYKAVKNKEFYPKFQPFVDTFTNEIVGFEAVSRWDLNGKLVRPRCFLKPAELTGLIYEIELQMFEEAIKFFRELKDNKEIKLSSRFKAAVHFTAYTLKRVNIFDLTEILKKYGISQKNVIIETKEEYITDVVAHTKIKEFRSYGFMVLLDDYSNSDASLSFLADLHVDAMKISDTLLEHIDKQSRICKSYECL